MDITGVILLTGIGLVVGFLVAALIFSLRRESSPEKKPRQELLSDTENKIRIWREAGNQQLVVEIDGAAYRQKGKLHAEQEKLLKNLVRELQTWLGPSTTALEGAPQPVMQAAVNFTPDEAEKNPSLNPLKVFGDALQPQKKTETDEIEQSIVSQIDKILQSKLEGTDLEDRGIKLVEGPDQRMVIEVGLGKYTEIETVPDEQVRQLIRLSVADWEKSLGD